MILGLIKPQEGSVKISGIDAGAALRGNFMYVPQGNTLLSGTIRTNLAMADPDAGEDAMWQALETACAGFVRRLPDGLDTVCGEIGSGLSEGQAQRIAIARSLLRPGGVLILDECTSALDSQTEQKLLQNLHDVYKGRKTIICISHRQAALNFADQVLNIEKQNNE
jgi:ABC-type multidrug transport system fused ATPase/permease subunit